MDHQTKEAAGYLCRWLLLAAAVGCAAAFAWAAGAAISSLRPGEPLDVIMSDGLARPGREIYAAAYILPWLQSPKTTEFMVTRPGPGVWFAYESGDRVYASLRDRTGPRRLRAENLPQAGRTYAVAIRGLPYGRYAFCRADAMVTVIPWRRSASAVDVRLLLDADDGQRRDFRHVVDLLAKRGQVVFFHVGRPGEPRRVQFRRLRSIRQLVRDSFPAVPLVFEFGRAGSDIGPLRRMSLTGRRRRATRPLVITGSRALAVAAAGHGFSVQMISTSTAGPAAGRTVTIHPSLKALADWLDSSPSSLRSGE